MIRNTDHKAVARGFLWTGFFFLVVGGLLSGWMRWQLGPVQQTPEAAAPARLYDTVVTMHAAFMLLFGMLPVLVGSFGTFLIPLQIGAPDTAHPALARLSLRATLVGGFLVLSSFAAELVMPGAPWSPNTPSPFGAYEGAGPLGHLLWLAALVSLGVGFTATAWNGVATVARLRAPGLSWFRLPISTWGLLIAFCLLLLAMPVMAGMSALLLADRIVGTGLFVAAYGGDPILWRHLWWFSLHSVVFALIVAAVGMVSEVLANRARKPLYNYRAMIFAMVAVAVLGALAWGHHMLESGLGVGAVHFFTWTTALLAVPGTLLVVNWIGTLWRGDVHLDTPMLHALGAVMMFVVGGVSGLYMAVTPATPYLEDGYFFVAQIHYVLVGGCVFGLFAALTYWFPKMWGRGFRPLLGRLHFALTFVLVNLAFVPMFEMGLHGQMRRVNDPVQLAVLGELDYAETLLQSNLHVTWMTIALLVTQLLFVVNYLLSMRSGRASGDNPWRATTLEWTTPVVPPTGNFPAGTPTVYRGAYEYSVPDAPADFLPQSAPPPP